MRFLQCCLLFSILIHFPPPPFVSSQYLLDVLLSQGAQPASLSPAVYLFAIDLYKKLLESDKDGNIFFSPTSIYLSLAMLYAGSEGETKKQLASTLHLDKFTSETEFYETIRYLIEAQVLPRIGYGYLHMTNRQFGQRGVPFKQAYNVSRDFFMAPLETADFRNRPGIPRYTQDDINNFAYRATWNQIEALLPQDVITNETILALASTVYTYASWLYEFDKNATRSQTFYTPTNEKIQVPMMHRILPDGILYAESKNKKFSLIELPFRNKRTSMIFALDQRYDDGSLLSTDVVGTPWDQHVDVFTNVSVHLAMPKFDLQQTVNLKKVLQVFGVKDVFDNAELTGIADSGPLRLSDAYHKASFVVYEHGVEAAGATGLALTMKSAATSTKQTYNVTVNRPFLFLVIDKTSGCVLFFAHIKNPQMSN